MGSEQHYSLRWNDYTVKIVTAFQSLRDEEDFVDVTVACDGHSYSAHKMVLSACSPYFRALLRANPCQHPIVILKDVGHVELERLLEFMYNGEVSIAQDQLAAFLKTAENLKIRGLAGSSDEMDQAGLHRPDVSYSYSSCAIGGGGTSGRSSPSAGYAPSQGSKDDEIVGDGSGGYHTRPESPPSKRRKRTSAPAAGHADSNTASHTTDVVGETPVEVDSGGTLGGGSIPGEDDLRLDRRELKSEPGDAMTEVYSESSEISTDPQSHSAMPGPSGSAGGQDSVGPHEPGGREDPECEARLGLPAAPNQGHLTAPAPAFPGGFAWPAPPGHQQAGGAGVAPPDNQCMFCFKSFSNRGSMTRHLRDQHLQPGATVTCDICGKVCKNRNCLITHRSVAHSARRRPRPPPPHAHHHQPHQQQPQHHHQQQPQTPQQSQQQQQQQQQQPQPQAWVSQDKGLVLVDMMPQPPSQPPPAAALPQHLQQAPQPHPHEVPTDQA